MGQPSDPQQPSDRRLSGWKENAAYMGRGVRTVQRWEREIGMPERRRPTGRGEAVFALVSELEEWRATAEAIRAEREPENGRSLTGRPSAVSDLPRPTEPAGNSKGPPPAEPRSGSDRDEFQILQIAEIEIRPDQNRRRISSGKVGHWAMLKRRAPLLLAGTLLLAS